MEVFSTFDPSLLHDPEHFRTGLEIILDYLNFGNTYEELYTIKNRSHRWCCEYYAVESFSRTTLNRVLEAHPCFFDFAIPSWDRLASSAMAMDEDWSEEDNAYMSGAADTTVTAFPEYTETVLLDDDVIFAIVDQMELEGQQMDLEDVDMDDPYSQMRTRLTAGPLRESPIIYYVPEVLCHFSKLKLDIIVELENSSLWPSRL